MSAKRSKVENTALCLIELDETNNIFKFNQEAIDFLSTIKRKIVTVSSAGPYRGGKSTLLNLAVLELEPGQNGFQTGSTSRSCTKGVWISKLTKDVKIDGVDCTIVAIDSEGMGSLEARSVEYNISILTLTLLCSSVMLYNHKGIISEETLQELGLLLKIVEKIRVSRTEAVSATPTYEDALNELRQLSDYLPSLIWTLRDASLTLVDDKGKSLTDTQYGEFALTPERDANQGKVRLRESITTSFPVRDCVVIGTPTIDPKWEKLVYCMPREEMSKGFRDGIYNLQQKLKKIMKPKQFRGVQLDGAAFAELVKIFTDAINQKENVPVMDDLCTNFSKQQIRIQYDKAWSHFQTQIQIVASQQAPRRRKGVVNNLQTPYFLNPYDFDQSMELHRKEALNVLQKGSMSNEPLLGEFEEKLQEEMNKVIEPMINANLNNISSWIGSEIAKIESVVRAPSTAMDNVVSLFQETLQRITSRCGESEGIYYMFYVEQEAGKKLCEWSIYLLESKLKELQEKVTTMQTDRTELDAAQMRYNDLKTQYDILVVETEQFKATTQQTIQQYLATIQEWQNKHQQLEQELQVNQNELKQAVATRDAVQEHLLQQLKEHGDYNAAHEKMMMEQQLAIDDYKSKNETLQRELVNAHQQIDILNKDLESLDVFMNDNADLKEQNLALANEVDMYKLNHSRLETDYESQLNEIRQEAMDTIEGNQQVFEQEKTALQEQLTKLKTEQEKQLTTQREELRNFTESKNLLQFQLNKLTDDNKRLEQSLTLSKTELANSNSLLHEKTEEFIRNLNQLHTKLREQTQLFHETKSNLSQTSIEKEMELTKQVQKFETEVAKSNARYEEMSKFYANHEDLVEAKMLREQNRSLIAKSSTAETQVKVLQLEKTERSKTITELQQQNINLEKRISDLMARHSFEVSKSQITSSRVTSLKK